MLRQFIHSTFSTAWILSIHGKPGNQVILYINHGHHILLKSSFLSWK